MVKIGFWIGDKLSYSHIISVIKYAKYHVSYLHGQSSILIHNNHKYLDKISKIINMDTDTCPCTVVDMFMVSQFQECDNIAKAGNFDIFYLLKDGYNDNQVSTVCKTVVHCLTDCSQPHGAIYSVVTTNLPEYIGQYPVVPLFENNNQMEVDEPMSQVSTIMDRFKQIFIDRRIILVDTIPFYNELDMLDFRLAEMADCVDYVILVESTQTYSGKPKSLYYADNMDRYEKYRNKIIHVTAGDYQTDDPWIREKYQRDHIQQGLKQLDHILHNYDIIMLSDCDEIPNVKLLRQYKNTGLYKPICLGQDFYYFNMTTKYDIQWGGTRLLPYHQFIQYAPESIRRCCDYPMIQRGGWHLSYFGNVKFIAEKIAGYSHQEYNNSNYNQPDIIQNAIITQTDLFHRGYNPSYYPLCKNTFLPEKYRWLLQHIKTPLDHILVAYYGSLGKYKNVSQIVLQKFVTVKDGLMTISIPENCGYNTYFGDPDPYQLKELIIAYGQQEYIIEENKGSYINIHTSDISK